MCSVAHQVVPFAPSTVCLLSGCECCRQRQTRSLPVRWTVLRWTSFPRPGTAAAEMLDAGETRAAHPAGAVCVQLSWKLSSCLSSCLQPARGLGQGPWAADPHRHGCPVVQGRKLPSFFQLFFCLQIFEVSHELQGPAQGMEGDEHLVWFSHIPKAISMGQSSGATAGSQQLPLSAQCQYGPGVQGKESGTVTVVYI